MMPNNRIRLLQNGEAYFPALEAALDRAMHDIYVETYIFENDNIGRRIAEALRRAALRGVKTHLLIDGFGSTGLPQTMVAKLETAGATVLRFRPKISPWTLRRRRLRRLHRKIVVVDQTIAFVGGINVHDGIDRHGHGDGGAANGCEQLEKEIDQPACGKLAKLWPGAVHDRHRGVCPGQTARPGRFDGPFRLNPATRIRLAGGRNGENPKRRIS